MLQYVILLGLAINFGSGIIYAKDTLSGKTKPNRITYLLWSLAPLISAGVALSEDGMQWPILPVLMAAFCPFMILCASFVNKGAYWKLHKFDYICGLLSLMALILWKIIHQPTAAIVLAIASDALASLPTIKKSWSHPETETPVFYVGGAVAPATSLLMVQTWKFSEYAFPIYLIAVCLIIFSVIYYRRSKMLHLETHS